MPINVSEYKNRFVKTKVVKLEEGVDFEVRRVSPLDMWDETPDPKKKTNVGDFMKRILLKGVVSPVLSDGEAEGCLNIKDLTMEHITTLSEAITDFSGYTEGGKKKDFLSQDKKD